MDERIAHIRKRMTEKPNEKYVVMQVGRAHGKTLEMITDLMMLDKERFDQAIKILTTEPTNKFRQSVAEEAIRVRKLMNLDSCGSETDALAQ